MPLRREIKKHSFKQFLNEDGVIFDNFLEIKRTIISNKIHIINVFYNNKRLGNAEIIINDCNIPGRGGGNLPEKNSMALPFYCISIFSSYLPGVGTKIMNFILKNYKGKIYLHVSKNNNEAKKFYQKFGFKEDLKYHTNDPDILFYSKNNK